MKVFEKNEGTGSWGNRMNFIDSNNLVVGYDYSQSCCEEFYWYASYDECTKDEDILVQDEWDDTSNKVADLPAIPLDDDELYFDKSYNRLFEDRDVNGVQFRILGGEKPIYLMLVNSHNGYYGHGFELSDSEGSVIFEGTL
jgi:hypothetical protein